MKTIMSVKRECIFLSVITTLLLLVLPGLTLAQEIKIGAIWPLTGSQAAVGQESKRGLEMAVDQVNASGGILGRKVKLILEDDKSDPSVGVAAINKLLTSEKIQFLVAGYSSTVMHPVLGRIKNSNTKVLSVINGTTSSKAEEDFGKEDWFFKLYPYDYHYQRSNVNFLKTLSPKPASVAIVYEDTLFGTTQGKFANQFLKEAGFNVALFEPFKSGTPDLSPLLTRVKATKAEVLFWIGYFGDCMLLVKQSKEINYSPKLFVGSTVWVGMPQFAEGLGKDSDNVVGIDLWAPDVHYPASKTYNRAFPSTEEWTGAYKQKYKIEPNHWSLVNYIGVEVIAQAAQRANTLDIKEVGKAMRKTDTMTPMGPLTFKQSQFGGTQGFTDMIVFQWKNGKRVIVHPAAVASGKLVYPTPAWTER
jgi:branched-chain amino acid transport system substrate-binding protein